MIARFEARSVAVNGVRLHVQFGGDPNGEPVLLWHGFLGSGDTWRKVAPLLVERGCAILVPDMRGYGDSDKPAGSDGYDGIALADEMRELVRQMRFGGDRPLTVVAHDMGAPPALLWAARFPQEIAGLAYLEEPLLLPDLLAQELAYTPAGTAMGGLWWWFMALADDIPERLIADGRERTFLTWFYERYTADPASIEPAAIDEYVRTFSGASAVAGAFGVYRAVLSTARQTAENTANAIDVPILALGGEKSQGDRVRAALGRIASRVQGGSLAQCGHFIPEERPEELVSRLAAAFPALRRR